MERIDEISSLSDKQVLILTAAPDPRGVAFPKYAQYM